MRSAETQSRLTALALGLLVMAAALWLSSAPAGEATTKTRTQTMQATVVPFLAWTNFGGCTSNMHENVDWGELEVNLYTQTSLQTGCLMSTSHPSSVSVVGTTPMTDGTNTIPWTGIRISTASLPTGSTAGCTGFECTLDVSRDVFTAAPAGYQKFEYRYAGATPQFQPTGTYTGGVVTFTALAE